MQTHAGNRSYAAHTVGITAKSLVKFFVCLYFSRTFKK